MQDKHFFLIRRLVAEGAGEDESADNAFRVFAVNTYLKACADFLVWKEQTTLLKFPLDRVGFSISELWFYTCGH